MPARLGWGHVTASSGWKPGAGMLRARATDSGEAAGRVRLYSSQALAHERCKPCSSEAPATAARTRSKLSSRAACTSDFAGIEPCNEQSACSYQWAAQVRGAALGKDCCMSAHLGKCPIQRSAAVGIASSCSSLRERCDRRRMHAARQKEVQVQ